MASDLQAQKAIVETYAKQHATIAAQLIRALLRIWLPLAWIGRPDLVNAAAAASAVQVDLANARARRLARAYMLRQLRLIDAEPDALPPIVDTYERSGTPIVEVYKRPARQVEHLIREKQKTKPEPWPELVTDDLAEALERRVTSLVKDDLAATARDESHRVMEAAPKVIGYRRVIHPELSKTGTCGLCIVASSRFYTKSELLELHDECKCTVSPLTATNDLGLKLNREDLDRIYEAAGSNYAEDLKRIRVVVREHGELGPILTRDGDAFRTIDDVNRASRRQKFTGFKRMTEADDKAMWAAHRDTSERSIRILEQARRDGTNLVDITGNGRKVRVRDIDQAIAYHRMLIARAHSHGA